jgi:PleD family two-component response regulator
MLAMSRNLSDHRPGRDGDDGRGKDRPEMERVLIVDDHPLVRDGLRSVIAVTFDGCDIFEAASLEEALSTLENRTIST